MTVDEIQILHKLGFTPEQITVISQAEAGPVPNPPVGSAPDPQPVPDTAPASDPVPTPAADPLPAADPAPSPAPDPDIDLRQTVTTLTATVSSLAAALQKTNIQNSSMPSPATESNVDQILTSILK